MTESTTRARWLFPALVLALLHGVLASVFLASRASGTTAALTGFPLDDAWIHLVYGRSLAAAEGLAYNSGEWESGFTSPLWVMLVAFGFWLEKLGLSSVLAVKLLGVFFGWLTSLLAYRTVVQLIGQRPEGWGAALLIALDPWLCYSRVSGMEVSLTTATVMLALWALTDGRPGLASAAVALATWARPECAILVLVAAPIVLWMSWRQSRSILLAASTFLPAAAAGAVWAAYCLATTGKPLPNTFYAKHVAHSAASTMNGVAKILTSVIGEMPSFWLGSGWLFLLVGSMKLLSAGVAGRVDSRRWIGLELLVQPLCLIGALAWAHRLLQPQAFYWHRYVEPALPLVLIPTGVGIGVLGRWAVASASKGEGRVIAVGALSLCLVPFARSPNLIWEKAELYSWNCQNINEVQVALGQWAAQNVMPEETIATNDAGAIRFFSQRRVLDLMGLNSHAVLQRGRAAVLAAERPRYLFVFPSWFPRLSRARELVKIYGARSQRYTICECPGQDEMVVLRTAASTIQP